MSNKCAPLLHEPVTVITPHGQRSGYLFRGRDGLPELEVEEWAELAPLSSTLLLRPATFPEAWSLQPLGRRYDAPLYEAWQKIEAVHEDLREAEREAEHETQEERDDIDEAKAYLEARGER